MTGSERNTCVSSGCDSDDRRQRIRALNDRLRRSGAGGVICLSAGVHALGAESLASALMAVFDFDGFTPDNDPYGEHDFGVLKVEGNRLFWKIDYYDRDRVYGSPDPADAAVTTRVLTIMLASEY